MYKPAYPFFTLVQLKVWNVSSNWSAFQPFPICCRGNNQRRKDPEGFWPGINSGLIKYITKNNIKGKVIATVKLSTQDLAGNRFHVACANFIPLSSPQIRVFNCNVVYSFFYNAKVSLMEEIRFFFNCIILNCNLSLTWIPAKQPGWQMLRTQKQLCNVCDTQSAKVSVLFNFLWTQQ